MLQLIIALVIVAAVCAFSRWPRTGQWFPVAALVLSATLSGVKLDLLGITIRLEYLVALALLLPWCARFLRHPRRPRWRAAELLLAGWVGLNLVVSLFKSPDQAGSIRLVAVYVLLAAVFFVARSEGERAPNLRPAMWSWLLISTAASLFALSCRLAYSFGLTLGVYPEPVTGAPLTFGVAWEANILGSYAASGVVMAIALVATSWGASRAAAIAVWTALVANAATVYVALSRGPWVALACGCVALFALALGRYAGVGMRRLGMATLIAVAAIAGTVMLTTAVDHLAPESGPIAGAPALPRPSSQATNQPGGVTRSVVGEQGPDGAADATEEGANLAVKRVTNPMNLATRHRLYTQALQGWRRSPMLGNGADSFGRTYQEIKGQKGWLSNLTLRVLYDTGAVGLALFILFLAVVFYRPLRRLWRRQAGPASAPLLALTVASVVLLVAYQFTDAMVLGYFWVLLGLMLGSARALPEWQATSRRTGSASSGGAERALDAAARKALTRREPATLDRSGGQA